MATDNPQFIPKMQAGGDLSSDQYRLVELDTYPQVTVCDDAGDIPLGSLYNFPSAAGQGADVAAPVPGTFIKVKVASAGVSAGDWVGTDANGEIVAKTTNNDYVIGRVLQAYVDNDVAEVLCAPGFLGV